MMVCVFVVMMRWWLVVCVVCRVAADVAPPWWDNAVYYRMLVDSFRDGDGDGLGDLKGALKQISYVRALGADAVILSPVAARSTDCNNPGITEFSDIDQRYGTQEDFTSLLEKAKKLGLKIVVTLPLQRVSTMSELFTSSANRVSGYERSVLWKDGTMDTAPAEHGMNWTWHAAREAYYSNTNDGAVVNLCCENVAAILSAAQCAWLRRGVAGVLLNPDFSSDLACGERLLKRLATDAMSCARTGGLDTPVILVESSLKPEQAAIYYGDDGSVGANSVLSSALTFPSRSTVETLLGIHASLLTAPSNGPTWITSNANDGRTASRYGSDMVDTVNLLALNLPGSAVIQQGDELAAADTILEWATATACWPSLAAPWAAPFPWDDTPTAGFTTSAEPWLPLAPNYRYANAKAEFANEFSHAGVVRVAAALRKSPAFGPHVEIKRQNGAVVVLRWGAAGSLLLISNLAKEPTEVDPSRVPGIPHEMTVATSSTGSSFSPASHLAMDKVIRLGPGQTVLLAGGPRHCGGPGPVDKIANKLSEGWQKINKYFSS